MKFSIIIPVYNVKDYLPKCIDSILVQDCSDCEILLVDDGSTDGESGKICDCYAAAHPTLIRTIHKPNGGLGDARNVGIEQAQGDYLSFIDSDDYVDASMLEKLRLAVERTQADIINFGFAVVKNRKITQRCIDPLPTDRVFTLSEMPQFLLCTPNACSRIWKRSLFTRTGIRFPARVWYEDIRVVTKILAVAQTALRLPGCYYHYLQREGSAMNNKNSGRNVEILYAYDDILEWYRSNGFYDTHRDVLEFQAIQHIFLAATVRVLLINRKDRLIADFRAYMEEHFPTFRENPYLPLLDSNKHLIFRLLLKKRYRTVALVFRVKKLLGR